MYAEFKRDVLDLSHVGIEHVFMQCNIAQNILLIHKTLWKFVQRNLLNIIFGHDLRRHLEANIYVLIIPAQNITVISEIL